MNSTTKKSPASNPVEVVEAESIGVEIHIAGDYDQARQVCREWTLKVGGCVTVDRTTYIYTGGEEAGVRVGFINYPRFPLDHDNMLANAKQLGDLLMERLCQLSYSITTPKRTIWYSRRGD